MSRGVAGADRRLLATVPLLGLPNLAGAVLVFVFQNVLAPGASDAEDVALELKAFLLYLAVSFPIAGTLSYLLVRPVRRWLLDDRSPTPMEQEAALAAPRRIAALGFAFWVGALVVFGGFAVVRGEPAYVIARDGAATVLGGLTTAVFAFLLVEAWLRPVVALALEGAVPPPRRTAGIAARILLPWALGSGVPLLAIGLAQLRLDVRVARPTPAALLFLAALGLSSGALLLALAAGSVAKPIAAVRRALERVRDGDVDTEVAVDDAGQIGQLQAGFNEMVRGLRERRRLEDLFGRYVGPEVAADAIARGAGLGGELRDVSVLFVDMIGSTEFAHGRDPADVVATLNDLFSTVVTVISAEGGWINKFEGDGAMCVFGAPADQPDHATRALRSARALRTALERLAARRPGVHAGIGVSTGAAVAGHVGAVERFEYTIIGDPVNEAARLTEAAKDVDGCLLASGTAIAAAAPDERACWRQVDTLTLRGRTLATDAWCPI